MKDITIITKSTVGYNDKEANYTYNLTKKEVKIEIIGKNDGEDVSEHENWNKSKRAINSLVKKEKKLLGEKIDQQLQTIRYCIQYNREDAGLKITKRKLKENKEKLEFLETFVYEPVEDEEKEKTQ